jgi:oxygen-independent coproporphyrinogen-3 oxidase
MIYIHIPYCKQRCVYCGFYSTAASNVSESYIDAVCNELKIRADYLTNRKIQTIYFGGGTPSLLTIKQLTRIQNTIAELFNLSELREATLECNPEQLTEQYLTNLRNTNFINRLSIGVQSFDNDNLKLLNRRHNCTDAINATKNAKKVGFDNITLDLIYGIPGLTNSRWIKNLNVIADLNIQHLSCYALTVEDGTMLKTLIDKSKISPTNEDQTIQHYESLIEWCSKNNFTQYEISNFCREGYEAKHNSRYWDNTPYLGIGAAAHSYNGTSRQWNISDIKNYIQSINNGIIPSTTENLSPKDCFNEYLMTALRTRRGLETEYLTNRYPNLWKTTEPKLSAYIQKDLMVSTPKGYHLNHEGMLLADAIAAELFI